MTAAPTTRSDGAPDLLYGELERDLRATVRQVLQDRAPWARTLALTESAVTVDDELWRVLSEAVGISALAIPEGAGGAGATWREVATVLEELGRSVASVPFLGSAVMATSVALQLDHVPVMRELASGTRGCLVVPLGAASWTQSEVVARGGECFGTVGGVADVPSSGLLLVPEAGGRILRVEADASGVGILPVVSLDMTRKLFDVALDGAECTVIAQGPEAARALTAARDVTSALLASEQLGVAEWCLTQTVEYLNQRTQFGRLLGSYQALRHRCAEMWVQITEARAVARYAAACAAEGDPDLPVAAALAQSVCGGVAVRAAEECVQLHGGVGFTWEFPIHLYLKRAKSLELALGSADVHRARIAELVGLPPAPQSV